MDAVDDEELNSLVNFLYPLNNIALDNLAGDKPDELVFLSHFRHSFVSKCPTLGCLAHIE
jgi:hypothetical protein